MKEILKRLSGSLLRQQSCLMVAVLLMVFDLSAQESAYRKVLAEIETMTPYAALYRLQQFQTLQPTFAPVYVEMGNRELQLAADLHPIRDYVELDRRLYNAALYLGNSMHYAPNTAGTIMPRVQEARTWRTQTDEVYRSFFALEERYTACRHLFTELVARYPGEKNAHLLLTDEDRILIQQLLLTSDSLQADFERYSQAVRAYGHSLREVHKLTVPIRLYRLDGLTPAEMMADTLLLWDYAEWARSFLSEQEKVYTSYLSAIDHALTSEQVNDTLVNYIDRLDQGSFVGQYLRVIAAEQMVKNDVDTLEIGSEQWLQHHYTRYLCRSNARLAVERCRSAVNDTEWRKYYRQLEAHGDSTPTMLLAHAEQRLANIEHIYNAHCQQLYTTMAPHLRLHAVYTNDLSGETVTVADLQLSEETLAGAGTVLELIPVDRHFLVVTESGVIHTEHPDQLLTYSVMPILAATKLSSNRIALIGSGETVFVDRLGNLIQGK